MNIGVSLTTFALVLSVTSCDKSGGKKDRTPPPPAGIDCPGQNNPELPWLECAKIGKHFSGGTCVDLPEDYKTISGLTQRTITIDRSTYQEFLSIEGTKATYTWVNADNRTYFQSFGCVNMSEDLSRFHLYAPTPDNCMEKVTKFDTKSYNLLHEAHQPVDVNALNEAVQGRTKISCTQPTDNQIRVPQNSSEPNGQSSKVPSKN